MSEASEAQSYLLTRFFLPRKSRLSLWFLLFAFAGVWRRLTQFGKVLLVSSVFPGPIPPDRRFPSRNRAHTHPAFVRPTHARTYARTPTGGREWSSTAKTRLRLLPVFHRERKRGLHGPFAGVPCEGGVLGNGLEPAIFAYQQHPSRKTSKKSRTKGTLDFREKFPGFSSMLYRSAFPCPP